MEPAAARIPTPTTGARAWEADGDARYRSLIEGATYGIYRSSAAGRFLMVNPALVRMLGYDSGDDLLAVDIAQDVYVDPLDRAQLAALCCEHQFCSLRGSERSGKVCRV